MEAFSDYIKIETRLDEIFTKFLNEQDEDSKFSNNVKMIIINKKEEFIVDENIKGFFNKIKDKFKNLKANVKRKIEKIKKRKDITDDEKETEIETVLSEYDESVQITFNESIEEYITSNGNDFKTFSEYLDNLKIIIDESKKSEEELNRIFDKKFDELCEKLRLMDLESLSEEELEKLVQENLIEEGVLGTIIGGLAGFALGKWIGKKVAKVLGVEKGILYDLFTSRLVGTAIGASIGKKI